MRNRTTFVIAHRLSHRGKRGPHPACWMKVWWSRLVHTAELLAQNGHYAALHRMQFRSLGRWSGGVRLVATRLVCECRLRRGALDPWPGSSVASCARERWLYARGWMHSVAVARPVVVVGNLTVGGTGKTPLVLWLATTIARTRPASGNHIARYRGYPSIASHQCRSQCEHRRG